jgi:hypothetical protein
MIWSEGVKAVDEELEWEDIIGEDEPLDDLEMEIALAEFKAAQLKAVKAMRGLAKACDSAAEVLRAWGDRHVLSSPIIDDSEWTHLQHTLNGLLLIASHLRGSTE